MCAVAYSFDFNFKSIDRAHNNMNQANIYYSTETLVDASINRSPSSYLNNPAYERAK